MSAASPAVEMSKAVPRGTAGLDPAMDPTIVKTLALIEDHHVAHGIPSVLEMRDIRTKMEAEASGHATAQSWRTTRSCPWDTRSRWSTAYSIVWSGKRLEEKRAE